MMMMMLSSDRTVNMQRDQIIEALSIWNFWETEIDTGIRREEYLDLFSRYLSTDEIVTVTTGLKR